MPIFAIFLSDEFLIFLTGSRAACRGERVPGVSSSLSAGGHSGGSDPAPPRIRWPGGPSFRRVKGVKDQEILSKCKKYKICVQKIFKILLSNLENERKNSTTAIIYSIFFVVYRFAAAAATVYEIPKNLSVVNENKI